MVLGEMYLLHNNKIRLFGTSVVFHATNVGILNASLTTFQLLNLYLLLMSANSLVNVGTHMVCVWKVPPMVGGERSENNFMELGNFLLHLA